MDHGVVEMSLFNEVTISKDENSVVIGVGAQQGEVFQLLGTKCLAVGLTLGGNYYEYSFPLNLILKGNLYIANTELLNRGYIFLFSLQYSFVKNSVLSYGLRSYYHGFLIY